jgi:hypothetical protein
LNDDERRRQRDRREHEQVARGAGPVAGGADDERQPGECERVAGPGDRPRDGAPEPGRHQRHQHRNDADDERGVGHARALDTGVLEHDHGAEAHSAGGQHSRSGGVAQPASPQQREQGCGGREATGRQPGRIEPLERELRERHGQTPQGARGGERQEGVAVGDSHGPHAGIDSPHEGP